jgi:threonine dehydrogenase-like Zn-dependent dehydrogenase
MSDKLAKYRQAGAPLPEKNHLWPLYGTGMEKLGVDGQPTEASMPDYGPDELLVRHDAIGLCFSDIKIIHLGSDHPRIYRDMQVNPVTIGHEVSMTIVDVGENLRCQYRIGNRFVIQPDIFVKGVGYAYGYEIQGGLSRYGVIDQRVLNGDHGNYLIPVQPDTGYAESALTEPWACVIAAYQLEYRTQLKPGGVTWIVAPPSLPEGKGLGASVNECTISTGFDEDAHPAQLLLSNVPHAFATWLKERAAVLGVTVTEAEDLHNPPLSSVDDIILLGADPDLVEIVSPHLANHGILALIAQESMPRKVAVDVERIHYDGCVYVGGSGPDIAQAYSAIPVRSSLKPGGRAWFVGAGGPMGRMHVAHALARGMSDRQSRDFRMGTGGPTTIVCTDVSDLRLDNLCTTFAAEAEAMGIEWICLNPLDKGTYEATMTNFREHGFDDIVVLAPVPAVIADAAAYLARRGVMNIFAGVARGTVADLDLSDTYLKDTRIIGHSGSTIDDLRLMLTQTESGTLAPNRSVAAIGSLGAARDGLQAVQDAVYPGKVIIYPHIKEMPLTAVPDLKDALPTVHAKLKDGREWTAEAEREFLRLMLP